MARAASVWGACRGVILDRCEDLTDAALIMLSRYETADDALLDSFTDLDITQAVGQASSVRQGTP